MKLKNNNNSNSNVLKYKFSNNKEKLIIEKYFEIRYLDNDEIYFYINDRILRRIKLLIIEKNESYLLLNDIIKKSKQVNYSIILELDCITKMTNELSKSIDREIMKRLIKINDVKK